MVSPPTCFQLPTRAYACYVSQVASTTAATARDAVLHLIRATGATMPLQLTERDPKIEERVKAIIETWAFRDHVHPAHMTTGILAAETAFSHLTDMDAKVAIATYATIMAILDDQELSDKYNAQSFAQMLCSGAVHHDAGPLGEFAKILAKIGVHFTSFSTTLIVSATLYAICGEVLSNPFNPLFTEPQNLGFAEYQRFMTGFAEVFAAFIWCKADFPAETAYFHVLP